jgi:hypothetical protein
MLLSFGSISIISLLYDMQKNILSIQKNIDQLQLSQILSIFMSNIFSFTLIFYGLYLLNPNNFFISLDKSKNKQYFHISTFINMFYMSYFNAITLGMNDVYPKSLICKLFLLIELTLSIVITIFFVNRIADIQVFSNSNNKTVNNKRINNKIVNNKIVNNKK